MRPSLPLCLFGVLNFSAFTGTLVREWLFGPETAAGRHEHPTSITELASGDLFVDL